MTSYEYAPSLAHIIQREAQAIISAELVSAMQRWLGPERSATACSGTWAYNGHPVYPKHYRYRLDSAGHVASLTPAGKTGEETA